MTQSTVLDSVDQPIEVGDSVVIHSNHSMHLAICVSLGKKQGTYVFPHNLGYKGSSSPLYIIDGDLFSWMGDNKKHNMPECALDMPTMIGLMRRTIEPQDVPDIMKVCAYLKSIAASGRSAEVQRGDVQGSYSRVPVDPLMDDAELASLVWMSMMGRISVAKHKVVKV